MGSSSWNLPLPSGNSAPPRASQEGAASGLCTSGLCTAGPRRQLPDQPGTGPGARTTEPAEVAMWAQRTRTQKELRQQGPSLGFLSSGSRATLPGEAVPLRSGRRPPLLPWQPPPRYPSLGLQAAPSALRACPAVGSCFLCAKALDLQLCASGGFSQEGHRVPSAWPKPRPSWDLNPSQGSGIPRWRATPPVETVSPERTQGRRVPRLVTHRVSPIVLLLSG